MAYKPTPRLIGRIKAAKRSKLSASRTNTEEIRAKLMNITLVNLVTIKLFFFIFLMARLIFTLNTTI
jgi:hypothetical protein